MELFAKRIFAIDTENAFKMSPHITGIEAKGQKVIKLNLGEPDFNIPDFVKEELKRQIDLNNTHYCDPKGILSLRTAICQQIYQTRSIKVEPDQVVIFPGAKPGIGFSQQVYCDPGDDIIYPSPGFPIYESFIKFLGAIPKPIHLKEENGFVFDPEELAALITPKTKLIFLNFPSNPTGGVATQNQLEKIAEVILKKGQKNLRIYSDEIYENILFDGQTLHSIASIDNLREKTIISSGFSKTYSWTGGRVGYAVFPTVKEADIFKNLNINYFSCVSPYNQEAARVALTHPDAQKTVMNMVKIFEERRNALLPLLHDIPGVHCQKPSGAFYVFPNIEKACLELGVMDAYDKLDANIKPTTSPSTLFQMFALYHHQVAVLDRRSFGKIGSEHEHFIRLSFASDIKVLAEGVTRLKRAFQDKQGFSAFMREGKHLINENNHRS